MINRSKRSSELDDFYNRHKIDKEVDEQEANQNLDEKEIEALQQDPYYNIKKNCSLSKDYEIFIETQKRYQAWKKLWNKDPMERVADKIRKAEDLDLSDLKLWVSYNFLALPKEEQEKVKQLNERQRWFWNRFTIITPPLAYGIYAVIKYQIKSKFVPSLLLTGLSLGVLIKAGLYSSNKDMENYYQQLFENYKDEVVNPKYRGLKLYKNKKAYQIDNKEYTTSNFDDLKQLIKSQIKR